MTVWGCIMEDNDVGNEELWIDLVKSTRLEENSTESVASVFTCLYSLYLVPYCVSTAGNASSPIR